MITGRSPVSTLCLFLLSTTLISCGGSDGGSDVAVSAGGEASTLNLSSNVVGVIDSPVSSGSVTTSGSVSTSVSVSVGALIPGPNDIVNWDTEVPPGPDFDELMASSAEAEAFGYVIDSAVSGLRYKSGAHYGVTDSDGKYGYRLDESIEFFIGDIAIGTVIEPRTRLTPYELADSDAQTALNLARFLQTLDSDGNPDNGIHIHDTVHSLAAGISVNFSDPAWQSTAPAMSDLELLVFELTSATEAGARNLVSVDEAVSHLTSEIAAVIDSLKSEAKSLMASSTCETDQQCKWIQLSERSFGPCPRGFENAVYSEVDADITAIESLETEREYLIGVDAVLRETAWPDNGTRALCFTSTTPTRAVCNQSNHCEITSALFSF